LSISRQSIQDSPIRDISHWEDAAAKCSFTTRVFTHHSSIITIVERRPYLLAPTGLIYSHHLTFGGKIGTIRATFVQKIAFNQTKKIIYAYDDIGKTFSIAKSDDRIN